MPIALSPRRLALVLALVGAACAHPAPPPPPAPVQQTPPPPARPQPPAELEPPAAAVRAAADVRLTGLELGTMWTFENPPLDYWAKQFGFRPTPQWLDHVRMSSLRYATYCSASFVSPDGLVMTNHHCGRECVEAQATPGHDYVASGFYAPTRADEKLCPGLFLDQLVSTEDVTQRFRTAIPATLPGTVQAARTDSLSAAIKNECEQQTKLICEVVALYNGGLYHLYRYKRYQPVKLVFAPELQAGFYGGDPDNFTYPRYALDVTFVRAYEADGTTPVHPTDYLRWRAEGPTDGEPVFVSGNPGSTNRLITVAQWMYERQFRHPFLIAYEESQERILQQRARQGPQAEQDVRQDLFETENALKAFRGEEAGLMDTLLLARKIAWQRDFQRRIEADSSLAARFGGVFDTLAAIQAEKLRLAPTLNLSNLNLFPSPHLQVAGTIVRLVHQRALPDSARAEDFRGDKLQALEARLGAQMPLDTASGRALLAENLRFMQRFLPPTDSLLREAIRPGETPEQAASRLIQGTRVGDVAFRKALLQGGVPAVDSSSDPLVRLAGAMAGTYRRLLPRWNDVRQRETVQEGRLARALFAAYGTAVAPDATFTLRISGGIVQGYPYNGTVAPPFTSIYGLYGRSNDFANRMPFTLPQAWWQHRNDVDLGKRLDMVSTNDITGGNSGSPLVDREGRVVGLVFDGNVESLPNNFMFPAPNSRAVAVDVSGITEALRSVYRADALLAELLGQK